MKVYNYCAIGNNKSNMTCVSSGIGAFSSEEVARNYLTDDFFTTNGVYTARVQITLVRRSQLQGLLNASENDPTKPA